MSPLSIPLACPVAPCKACSYAAMRAVSHWRDARRRWREQREAQEGAKAALVSARRLTAAPKQSASPPFLARDAWLVVFGEDFDDSTSRPRHRHRAGDGRVHPSASGEPERVPQYQCAACTERAVNALSTHGSAISTLAPAFEPRGTVTHSGAGDLPTDSRFLARRYAAWRRFLNLW
jgi:hypothetical protein